MQNLSIKTSWHSGKDFIYAISTTKFQDFIEKWEIKDPSLISYRLINQNERLTSEDKPINQNKFPQKQIRISNNLLMIILWFFAAILVGIILDFR